MNTPTTSRFEYLPRSRRRLLVAVALAGYPVAVAVLAGLKHTGLNLWLSLVLYLVVLLPRLVALSVGVQYAQGRAGGNTTGLDERGLALRQQAYALSHRVLAAILTAAAVITEIYLSIGNTIRLDADTFWHATIWVLVYIPLLPSLMLAWIEIDQPADA